MEYAGQVYNIVGKAPKLSWELDASGKSLEGYVQKHSWSPWQAHHDGDTFLGPMEPFRRLCFYKDMKKDRNPSDDATIPGFFMGWKIEAGMRYRDMLKIAGYHAFKK
eukprot:8603632-Karenia_brevis.AAC.1